MSDQSKSNQVSDSELDALADLIGIDDGDAAPDTSVDAGQLAEQATQQVQAVATQTGSTAGATASSPAAETPPPVAVDLPAMQPLAAGGIVSGIDLLKDVDLDVKIELGRNRMLVEDVLKLGEGSVVELDKLAGDPVDVFVNDRLVARGEVLVYNDDFCVRVNEIIADPSDEN